MMDAFDLRIRAKFTDVLHTKQDMHQYQAGMAVPFLLDNPFSFLLIDLGLGKTVVSLTVITEVLNSLTYGGPVLVIGPMRVATQTWPNEIREWLHTAHLNHSLIHIPDDHPEVLDAARKGRAQARLQGMGQGEAASAGNAAAQACKERLRIAATRSKASLHIIPINWVEWLVDYWGPKWPYRIVFIDESSMMKDHKTNRFKALAKVRNHPGLIERMHLLTATPAAESYLNFFAQTFLIDGGKRFGVHITHYQKRYFTQNRYTRKWEIRPGGEEDILAKIADIALVMKAEDYLNLEEPTIIRRPIKLGEAEMALYKRMETDFVVTLPDGSEVEAATAAALSQKLLQMASGMLYETYLDEDLETEDFKKVKKVHHVHDQKIEELQQLVEEAQGQPILVSYHWQSSLTRLKKAFPNAVVMDREGKCVKKWNAGKIPMLLMHPQSGGHGLNLQRGGHILAIYDLFYSLELFIQLVGRLARQGQKHKVMVYIFTALDTLDEAVADALRAKEDAQDKMFRMLRRLIKKHRRTRDNDETL